MASLPRLIGQELADLLGQYSGDMQDIEFMYKAGYLSDVEYQRLSSRGISSAEDFQGDIHDFLDLEGLDEIQEKHSELIARIMSHKIGVPYEEWIKPDIEDEEQGESMEELLNCLRSAWEIDQRFNLCSYSSDRSQRVLITLVQGTDSSLYDEDNRKVEVYRESFSQCNSHREVTIARSDESYTWYYVDEVVHGEDDISPSQLSAAISDFLSQVKVIGGGPIEANGKEEQDVDAILSAVDRVRSK